MAIRRGRAGRPGRRSHFVILGGMRVQDGRAFERLVREAVEQDPKPDEGVKVTFDVAKAADGTAIHQMTGPVR